MPDASVSVYAPDQSMQAGPYILSCRNEEALRKGFEFVKCGEPSGP